MSGGIVSSLTIETGWPPRQLSPNARVHHFEHYRFKKAAKDTAFWLTRSVLGHDKFGHDGEIPVAIVAHPIKGKERPDADNMVASMKAVLDGIALGLGVDDKRFAAPTVEFAEPVPNGKVIVRVGL